MYSFESLSLNTRQGSGLVHFTVLPPVHNAFSIWCKFQHHDTTHFIANLWKPTQATCGILNLFHFKNQKDA